MKFLASELKRVKPEAPIWSNESSEHLFNEKCSEFSGKRILDFSVASTKKDFEKKRRASFSGFVNLPSDFLEYPPVSDKDKGRNIQLLRTEETSKQISLPRFSSKQKSKPTVLQSSTPKLYARRKSCECSECGGVARLEKMTGDIVVSVVRPRPQPVNELPILTELQPVSKTQTSKRRRSMMGQLTFLKTGLSRSNNLRLKSEGSTSKQMNLESYDLDSKLLNEESKAAWKSVNLTHTILEAEASPLLPKKPKNINTDSHVSKERRSSRNISIPETRDSILKSPPNGYKAVVPESVGSKLVLKYNLNENSLKTDSLFQAELYDRRERRINASNPYLSSKAQHHDNPVKKNLVECIYIDDIPSGWRNRRRTMAEINSQKNEKVFRSKVIENKSLLSANYLSHIDQINTTLAEFSAEDQKLQSILGLMNPRVQWIKEADARKESQAENENLLQINIKTENKNTAESTKALDSTDFLKLPRVVKPQNNSISLVSMGNVKNRNFAEKDLCYTAQSDSLLGPESFNFPKDISDVKKSSAYDPLIRKFSLNAIESMGSNRLSGEVSSSHSKLKQESPMNKIMKDLKQVLMKNGRENYLSKNTRSNSLGSNKLFLFP